MIMRLLLLLPLLLGYAAAGFAEVPGGFSQSPGIFEKLRDRLGIQSGGAPQFLPPDQAFSLNVRARDGNTLLADFRITDNYYLYRDKVAFSVKDAQGVAVAAVALPQGDMKNDPNFGPTQVYHRPFQAVVTLKRGDAGEGRVTLAATYQGCSEKGLCYPPINKTFDLLLPAAAAAGLPAASPPPALQAKGADSPLFPESGAASAGRSESSRVAALFKGGSFWLVVVSFFGFGLLLSFTPCVFPMIPILSGIIVGRGHHVTRSHGFSLSLAYVLGMAMTYAVAGVAAGLSGAMLSVALQKPWVLGSFALVFVLLAFSMFGFYELQLPSALQSKLTDRANRFRGGHFAGVFAMGALSAVIVGPCVAAPLAGALLYIGQSHDVVLGGTALFAMALGMGAPLLLLGLSAGTLLPRAGAWMQAVRNFFGVVLLGTAIWLISPAIPAVASMLLWAALLIVSAVYLHALDPLPPGASGFKKLWKGVGVIALLTGVVMLIGALSGGRDILQPLSGLRVAAAGGTAQAAPHLEFRRVKTAAELDAQLARAQGRYVMLDFYADWCISCKELERFTFTDPGVQAALRDVVLLQADVTANSDEDNALLRRFSLFGPPGIIFFDRKGGELPERIIGYQKPEEFLASLNAVLR